jgi:glycosyltransferase involved in cell wall biosynthesis
MMSGLSPLVTIGLPVFNGEDYIRDAIDSVLSQSFYRFKLVIADNCSVDATPEILKEYELNDSRVTAIRHENNIGGLENLFYLAKNISTPYFMWFAHDDVMEKDFLRTCVEILDTNLSVDMAFTGMRNIDINGKCIRLYPNFQMQPVNSTFMGLLEYIFEPEFNGKANLIYSLYRSVKLTKLIHDNKIQLSAPWGPDVAFIFSILCSGSNIKIDEKVLFNKRCFQPKEEIGDMLLIPKSYLLKSVYPVNFRSLKKFYSIAIKRYRRSYFLIVGANIRQCCLTLLYFFYALKVIWIPMLIRHYEIKRYELIQLAVLARSRYHQKIHKFNLYSIALADKYPILRKFKRLIFGKKN